MTLEDTLRQIVREEVRAAIQARPPAEPDGLASVPRAAKVVGLHPSTVREQYLARLTKYGSGRKVRISVAELRQLMRVEASGEEVDLDARADALEKKGRRR